MEKRSGKSGKTRKYTKGIMKHGRYNVWEVDKCDRLFRLESVRGKCFVAFFSPHSWERDFFFLMNLNRHLIFESLYTTNAVPQFHYLIRTYFLLC